MTTPLSDFFVHRQKDRWYDPVTGRLVTSVTIDGRTTYHVWDDRHETGPREYLGCRRDLEEAFKIAMGYGVNRKFPIEVTHTDLIFTDTPEIIYRIKKARLEASATYKVIMPVDHVPIGGPRFAINQQLPNQGRKANLVPKRARKRRYRV